MADTNDVHTLAFETDAFSLTRLEVAAVVGAGLVLVSLVLPWTSGFAGGVSGLAFTWLSPAFVAGGVLALLLSVLDGYTRIRYAMLALVGVTSAAVGVVLLLGMPPGTTGVGVLAFGLGGLLVASGGYGSLVRVMSTYRATAVVCIGSLLTLTIGVVLLEIS